MKTITMLMALTVELACLVSCSSDKQNPTTPTPGDTPVIQEPNLSWTITPSFQTMPSGEQCTLILKVTNSGDSPSIPIQGYARSQNSSSASGAIPPWSSSRELYWEETGSKYSPVPAHSSLTSKYVFNADDHGKFVVSMWLNAFGWVTHEKDEGGGQWSQEFTPAPVSNG